MPHRSTIRVKPLAAGALVSAMVRAGVIASAVALPAAAATAASIPTVSAVVHAASAAREILYLAQAADDGYGKVPHLRPQPETPVTRSQPTGTSTGSTGSDAVIPRTPIKSPPPPPPKDSRDSGR